MQSIKSVVKSSFIALVVSASLQVAATPNKETESSINDLQMEDLSPTFLHNQASRYIANIITRNHYTILQL